MSTKYDCKACGQDLRMPPINFQRMNWILRLFEKIADEDREWVVARLASDLRKPKPRKRGRPRKVKP